MQTYPSEAKKAVDEAERQAAVRMHRFVKPFERPNTIMWRDRERIRNALRHVRDNADEAWLCLEKAEREERDIVQASTALHEMDEALRELSGEAASSFAAPTLLGALNQATKDFDMEAWKEQDSSCLLCHAAMGLDFGCEWPDDPRLLLCWDCMSKVLAEMLATVQAPNKKISGADQPASKP